MQRRSAGGLGSKGNAGLEGRRHDAKQGLDGSAARAETVAMATFASGCACWRQYLGRRRFQCNELNVSILQFIVPLNDHHPQTATLIDDIMWKFGSEHV